VDRFDVGHAADDVVFEPDAVPRARRQPQRRSAWLAHVVELREAGDRVGQLADWASRSAVGDEWEDVVRDGKVIRATRRDARSEAQAQFEHDGIFVILTSRTLTRDQLATIAAGLKPAPATSSI
jgi:hypothetical protein